jgi:hypothetical protein
MTDETHLGRLAGRRKARREKPGGKSRDGKAWREQVFSLLVYLSLVS